MFKETIKTSLIKYDFKNIYLKPENLQIYGSYKVRGVENLFSKIDREKIKNGVVSISAGNMGQTIAHMAMVYKIKCTIIVPDSTPQNKIDKIMSLNAEIVKKPMEDIWDIMIKGKIDGYDDKYFIHTHDKLLIEGYASMAYEIIDQLPKVTDVIIPFGTGSLTRGLAKVFKEYNKNIKIHTVEPEALSPLSDLINKKSDTISFKKDSVIDAIGAPSVLPMFQNFHNLVDYAHTISDDESLNSINELLFKHKLLSEPGGAASLSALRYRKIKGKNIVCIITGGNIEKSLLTRVIKSNN